MENSLSTPSRKKKTSIVLYLQNFLKEVGEITRFFLRFFREAFVPPYELREIARHSYFVLVKSLLLVSVTAFIVGLVFVIQSRPSLVEFGAVAYLPAMASISIIREIGPLITAMVCAGNIGSSMSAELGSMKVTEQIDSMEVFGAGPFKYLAVTRIIACTLMVPILVIYADLISMVGSYVGANIYDNFSPTLFYREVLGRMDFSDLLPSVGKAFLFGFAIGLIGCYKGFSSSKGTEGVGRAANAAVVFSLLFVILIDMVIVQLLSILNWL